MIKICAERGWMIMRNPNRLDSFYKEFCKIHKEKFCDWRFGQLISNFFGWIWEEKKIDIWFPEEDRMIELFREYSQSIIKGDNP